MIYVFDLDGTLCYTSGRDYAQSVPIPAWIAIVNALYDEGHTIIIDSARGSVTGEDWVMRTRDQLKAWGLKYTTFQAGVKPYGDWYIDDKAIPAWQFFAPRTIYRETD